MVTFFELLCFLSSLIMVYCTIQFKRLKGNERIEVELERINSLKGLEKVKYKIKNAFKKQKKLEIKPVKYTENQLKKYIIASISIFIISFIGIGITTPTSEKTHSNNTYISKSFIDRNKNNEIKNEYKNEVNIEEEQNIQHIDNIILEESNEKEYDADKHKDKEFENETEKEEHIKIEENNIQIQESDNKSSIENEIKNTNEKEIKNIEKDQSVSSNSSNNEKSSANLNTRTKPTTSSQSTSSSISTNDDISSSYVLNTNTKKFHYPGCGSAKQISEKNRQEYEGSRNDLISRGYAPCKKCNP